MRTIGILLMDLEKPSKICTGAKLNGFMTFLYGVWYIPFIFLADRVYFPIVTRFGVKEKDNSYYCMSSAGDVWYSGRKNYLKRVCKKFNEDKEYTFPALAECLKQEKWQYIDIEALEKWLNDYEFDENSLGITRQIPNFVMLLEVSPIACLDNNFSCFFSRSSLLRDRSFCFH